MPAIGFIADPLDRFDIEAETTLFLMKEAVRRGFKIFFCEPKDLFLKGPIPWATMYELKLLWPKSKSPFYKIRATHTVRLDSLEVLWLRKDPPFDLTYLHHLYLLAPLRGKIPIVNDPVGIMEANEKLVALQFPQWIPETIVTSTPSQILHFVKSHRHGAVLKPLHASGGLGVLWVKRDETNLMATIDMATAGGERPITCQEFLPGVKRGDKRILLADDKSLGAFIRIAKPGDFLSNLHQGGSFHKAEMTTREKKIVAEVGPYLQERGLLFTGLDVIDGRLTEINVTSPMGIRELNATQGGRAERRIFDCVLKDR